VAFQLGNRKFVKASINALSVHKFALAFALISAIGSLVLFFAFTVMAMLFTEFTGQGMSMGPVFSLGFLVALR